MNEVFLIVKSLGLLYDNLALTFDSVDAPSLKLNISLFSI